jgi:NAD(P)-dependent dehydrogenase (short-subunit alcohol dehydrogenase family)
MDICIVTGASRGIGAEIARQLLARGHHVIGLARGAAAPFAAPGFEFLGQTDINNAESRAALCTLIGSRNVSWLIHNAGILRDDALLQSRREPILEQFETNALAPLLLTQDLLPFMRAGAKIAFITSRMGSIADNSSGGHYGYRMSKAALNAAGKSMAIDLRTRGIAVALLHPGFVRTAMTSGQGQLDAEESASLLLKRLDALNLADSGGFWHANGELLPW